MGGGDSESVYARCGMSTCESELKWFSHVERMGSGEFVKEVYESESEGPNQRERSLARLKVRVTEHLGEGGMSGRGVLEQARRECWDRGRWRGFCCGRSLGEHSPREQDVSAIDIDNDK